MRTRTIVIIVVVGVLIIAGVVAAEVQRAHKIAELLDDLDSDKPDVAMDTLQELRKRGHHIVDELLARTNSPRRKERMRAAILLGEIGAEKAGPALVQLLHDEWLPVRRAAVIALGSIQYLPAAGDLIAMVNDEQAEMDTRCLAVQALGKLCLGELSEADRGLIVLSLKKILERRPEVPPEVEEEAAAEAPETPAEPAEEPIPPEPVPADTEIELRAEAVLTLGLTGVEAALEPLLESLSDRVEPSAVVRQYACMAVEDWPEVPSDTKAALKMGEALLKALEDDDATVRMFAARALARHSDFGDELEGLDKRIATKLAEMAVELTEGGEAGYWVREAARTACDSRHIPYHKEPEEENATGLATVAANTP
ncbi:MAG: HEAT repeat domain-containing protein [Candidatus Zipacnadales bacterium]